jgi:thiamine-phosphate pyrophosphorylase
MDDLSPAVERAIAAADALARERGSGTPSIVDWLKVLLADDEGRPAMLLASLGHSTPGILGQLAAATALPLPATDLTRRARHHALRLRADPAFTTDLVMLAALFEDTILADSLGVRLDQLEAALRSPLVETNSRAGGVSPLIPETPFALPDITDKNDAARIVDANLNRARESLRVLDDFARFVRNDSALSETLKGLRHRLADLGSHLPLASLLAARDTVGDVGTGLSADGEYERGSPAHVAAVNCKRLQESLRSIEEFGKLISPFAAREVEAIRYEAYTLERALLGGSPLRERLNAARLYLLVSGEGCTASLDWTIAEAAAGGVDVVQLREKNLSDRDLLARARQVRQWTRQANVLFIVNDCPDIARLCDADGVHLGQDDLSVADARRILGPQPLIGVSTHNLDQVRGAIRDGADYIGIGPTFPSTTKGFETLAGPEFIAAGAKETSLPAFALGGINAKTIAEAVAAGATRVAVSAAICQADDPRSAAVQLRNSL